MRIVFRVDASLEIGTGHTMRCLTFADELKRLGVKCTFITRAHPGNMADAVEERGYKIALLPSPSEVYQARQNNVAHASWLGVSWEQDAEETLRAIGALKPDWLVVDHYGIDARWHRKLIDRVDKIMVIDDLADRSHDCDLLLDQNLGRETSDYANRVPASCIILTGPKHALLRPEFATLREYSLRRRKNAKIAHVLITMGGIDQHNATGKLLAALNECPLPLNCRITVVMGQNAPWLDNVQQQAGMLPWRTEVLVNIGDMAQRMADSDLAIGAAGATSWERCCLGLPTIVVVLAENQRLPARRMVKAGLALELNLGDNLHSALEEMVGELARHPECLKKMSERAAEVTEGNGAQRLVALIENMDKNVAAC